MLTTQRPPYDVWKAKIFTRRIIGFVEPTKHVARNYSIHERVHFLSGIAASRVLPLKMRKTQLHRKNIVTAFHTAASLHAYTRAFAVNVISELHANHRKSSICNAAAGGGC